MAARNFLPRFTAFFHRIPIESLKICNSSAMHLGKNSSPQYLAQSSIKVFGVVASNKLKVLVLNKQFVK